MIRLFDLRDLALLHRLSGQAISLHAESALTNDNRPLRRALTGMVIGRDISTYVWKSDTGDAAGFAQVQLSDDGLQAQLVYVALAADGDSAAAGSGAPDDREALAEGNWLQLLDELVGEAGQRGVHSLVAEADEAGPELRWLRRAGFAVYTRQDVWQLGSLLLDGDPGLLQPHRSLDDWDVNLLYANTVPRLIQLVEPAPPLAGGSGWVLREEGELMAFVQRRDGPGGSWLRLFVHPSAHTESEEILAAALKLGSPVERQRVYCCIPRYQSWLQLGLRRLGFELRCSQAVMVKHTVQRAQPELPALSPAIRPQTVARTTPLIQPAGRRPQSAWPALCSRHSPYAWSPRRPHSGICTRN